MKAAFTSATISYLPRAFTLAKSFLNHNQGYQFFIFIIDPDEHTSPFRSPNIHLISVENIGITDFDALTKKKNVSEISFTLKPVLSLYLLEKYPDLEVAFYFDADILVYHNLAEAEHLLQTNDFLITPHFLHPVEDAAIPTELDILRTGLYNMGFAGFRNCHNTKQLLLWWKARVLQFGYENHDLGLTADQMWMNLAPLMFQKVGIIRNPGYNFAYWNVHERTLNKEQEKVKVNEKYPLVFIHFADFDPGKPHQFTHPKHFNRRIARGHEILQELCIAYAESLVSNHFNEYINIKSKFSKSPRQQARLQLLSASSMHEWLKNTIILFFNFLPAFMRRPIRKFSLFIIRNIK